MAIPTYNERDNILALLELFDRAGGDYDILFIDDNSPDGTAALIESLQTERKNLLLVKRPAKNGIGSAHLDAISYAYGNGYKILATMDADLTHDPAYLPKLLSLVAYTDVVVGSRYLVSHSLPGWSLFRRALTSSGHFATRFFLKMPYDATGALRVYNLETIPSQIFSLIQSKGYSFFYESLFILWTNGKNIAEVPIELPARTYGTSKMAKEQVLISIFRLVLLYTNLRIAPEMNRLRPARVEFDAPTGSPVPTENAWDRYWGGAEKESAPDVLFQICATWFRMLFIKPFLERVMRVTFSNGERLLHAGCGSGQVDQTIRHWFDITACDLSKDALFKYSQVNAPHCRARAADLLNLPFEEEFDGVYNMGVMEHFTTDQILQTLREFHRVLKPGGRIVLFWPASFSPIRAVLAVFHWVSALFFGKSKAPLYPPEISRVKSRSQVDGWLTSTGFKLQKCEFTAKDLWTQYVFVAEKQ